MRSGLGEALEPMLAEVARPARRRARSSVVGGDEDLTAVAGSSRSAPRGRRRGPCSPPRRDDGAPVWRPMRTRTRSSPGQLGVAQRALHRRGPRPRRQPASPNAATNSSPTASTSTPSVRGDLRRAACDAGARSPAGSRAGASRCNARRALDVREEERDDAGRASHVYGRASVFRQLVALVGERDLRANATCRRRPGSRSRATRRAPRPGRPARAARCRPPDRRPRPRRRRRSREHAVRSSRPRRAPTTPARTWRRSRAPRRRRSTRPPRPPREPLVGGRRARPEAARARRAPRARRRSPRSVRTAGWIPRASSRSSSSACVSSSRAPARSAAAPSGLGRELRLRRARSATDSATSRCCAPSCRLRSSPRRASSSARTSRAREARQVLGDPLALA